MCILIDDRAGSKELVDDPSLSDVAALTRLDSADVCWTGHGPDGPVLVGVEVKQLSDLVTSVRAGRAQDQVRRMLAEYDAAWLLWYGECRRGQGAPAPLEVRVTRGTWAGWRVYQQGRGGRPIPWSWLASWLMTVETAGVRVQHVRDAGEAAAWIRCAWAWWQKPWAEHKGLKTFNRAGEVSLLPGVPDGVAARARIAGQLPGLGYERALAAARVFRSVAEMMGAGEEAWRRVPGVGKVIARSVVEYVRRRDE